jgi:hypothetical protein
MVIHDLRNVRLAFDGQTLICGEHGPLAGNEADAVWNRYRLLRGDSPEGALERVTRLERWPTRWLVKVVQSLHAFIDPPRCVTTDV